MGRLRRLRVLFVRSGAREGLSPLLQLGGARAESAAELPFGLLRLASAVKYASPHQALVHDARHPSSRDSIRNTTAIHRPDLVLVWMDAAYLIDGLRACREVRQAGCETVLATGPLVTTWPEAASSLPEIDGLVGHWSPSSLLGQLSVLARSGSAADLRASSQPDPGPGNHSSSLDPQCEDYVIDRKLVDYAKYVRNPADWPGLALPPPSQLARIGVSSDKGRNSSSQIMLWEASGSLASPMRVASDTAECALLGIPWQRLHAMDSGHAPGLSQDLPDKGWWTTLLELLAEQPAGLGPTRVRRSIGLAPSILRQLKPGLLAVAAVQRIHLGELSSDDATSLDDLEAALRSMRRRGIACSARVLLPASPAEPGALRVRLETLRKLGVRLHVVVDLPRSSLLGSAWSSWLSAPRPDFIPKEVSEDALAIASAFSLEGSPGHHPGSEQLGETIGTGGLVALIKQRLL